MQRLIHLLAACAGLSARRNLAQALFVTIIHGRPRGAEVPLLDHLWCTLRKALRSTAGELKRHAQELHKLHSMMSGTAAFTQQAVDAYLADVASSTATAPKRPVQSGTPADDVEYELYVAERLRNAYCKLVAQLRTCA